MLRAVITPVLSPGVLVYQEIWGQGTQSLSDVKQALAWELKRDESNLPSFVQVFGSEKGFVVIVLKDKHYQRLLDYSDVIFIQEGCYVLSQRGPYPCMPDTRRDEHDLQHLNL
jgi:hypothetical protein